MITPLPALDRTDPTFKADVNTFFATQLPTFSVEVQAEIDSVNDSLADKAPLDSPALTGTPTAPTPTVGDNTTKLATTEFVQQAALSATLPNQAGNTGKFLSTDGFAATWENVSLVIGADNGATVRYLTFTDAAGSGKSLSVDASTTPLAYTPSTNTLAANITGNAATATTAGSATNATNATNINLASINTSVTRYLTFAAGTGNQALEIDSGTTPLSYNPNSNLLSTNISGNAATATSATTAASATTATTAGNVSGTVAVPNGGTGQTSYTNGQLLIGNTTGNTLTKATLTAGAGVAITNGNGSITIAAAAVYELVASATASASSVIEFTGLEAGYTYLVIGNDVRLATQQNLQVQVGVTGGTYRNGAGDYNNASFGGSAISGGHGIVFSPPNSTARTNFVLTMFNLGTSNFHSMISDSTSSDGATVTPGRYSIGIDLSEAHDRIRFNTSSTTITSGTFNLYRIKWS